MNTIYLFNLFNITQTILNTCEKEMIHWKIQMYVACHKNARLRRIIRDNDNGTGKFKYGPNTQQNYKYSVEIRSLFNGTSKNDSSLYVEGTVGLGFLTPCDGLLTLSDIKLSEIIPKDGSESPEHANSQQFADMLSEYSLRFAFKDGIITELCPREEEQSWVLNFKRGVLSMLHNTMKRLDMDHSVDEEDVRGRCTTYYKVVGAKETSLLIEKRKDLDSCHGRSKLHSILQSTSIPLFQSNVRRENILKSSSECGLSIDHNIYKEITCKDIHVLQPFSNKNTGASTVVVQKLVLLNEELRETISDGIEISRRASLSFDHTVTPKSTHDDLRSSKDLIRQLCKLNGQDVRIELSELFSRFIRSLRLLSYTSISTLYGQARSTCPNGKRNFQDALPYVNTAASVALMKDIILKEPISESTVNEWLASIAFIGSPDADMMKASLQLLRTKTFTPNIALSVSSLTHTYCIQHTNCIDNDSVYSIVQYLESYLQEIIKRNIDRTTYDNIMVTLKALSNIGVISEDFQTELFKVIENSSLDVGIRIGAVETFRRLPCEGTRSYFERIFRNQDEDAEVRILSYLQIMRCPNYLLIRTIRHTLQHEEVNQVGSFIWTHLNNILKSAIPSRVEIQSLLSDRDLVKKFDSDVRKYSHNFEGSMYFDDYNFGGSYESNIIFSTSSYIPRSGMLNLTVDLFGESVNLLEVYGRAEGFEHYLESLFGPKGSSKTVKDNIMDKLRWARSTGENEVIKSQVEALPNVVNTISEPKVALGLKVFGNEINYATFNGEKEIRDAIETLNPVYHLKRILSGKEINYNKAAMFLDSNYVVPSGAGLPLSLNAIGTASINIKLYGSLQAAGFSKDKELELDLTANIQPTVSLDITGEMSVDAFYASTGIKLKTNMYTDSAIKATAKVRGTKLASIKFSLPKQTNEIFAARSELLVKKNDKEEPQSGISAGGSKSRCFFWSAVSRAVGLNLCADYNFVNVVEMENMPHLLLAGPAGFRWYLNKTDPTANVYLFEYKWTKRRDMSVVSLTFDTPGSQMKTLLSANLTIDKHTQNLTMIAQSTEGTVLTRGRYKNTEDEKFIQATLDINNKNHFDASAALTRHKLRNGFSYRPTAYLEITGDRVVTLEGAVDWINKKGISQHSVDLNFHTKRLRSKLFGYISKSDSSFEVNLYNDYKFHRVKEQRIALKFGVANRSRKNIFVIVGFCNLNTTAYPNINFASDATFQKSGGHMDLTVKLLQNPLSEDHPEADFQTLRFNLLYSYKTYSDNKRTVTVIAGVSRKSTNLALKSEFIYETYRHDINLAAVVKYGNNKQVSMTFYWSYPRTTLEQIKAHVNITIPSFTPMVLKVDIEEKTPKDYIVDIKGTWFSGHSMTAVGFYQDKSVGPSSNHHVKLFLKSPNFKEVNTDLQFYRDNDILKVDLKVFHNNNDYQLFFQHQSVSTNETKTLAKIKYKTQLYRFISSIYDAEYKKIHAELKLDQ
ncbi:hypothetical protein NQ317_002630 [Molorchus minor]|uniref:Vitellogenin domain-containing protein n=1 Tax=Molorchus minor TaxID=1323400 RepID=A0ABQ9IX70_9CUCU|nr:hypothetical protein NQ317_002630 [Molorchus minor]